MKYTSQEANKLLRQLEEALSALQREEANGKEFLCAVGENIEDVRPDYDYVSIRDAEDALESKIRKIKHAINLFNTTHMVDGFGMTIDEMLVYLPQLTAKKHKLFSMKCTPQKRRESVIGAGKSSIIDYLYANYDLAVVKADFDEVSDRLVKAQLALDRINSTETMEIDL